LASVNKNGATSMDRYVKKRYLISIILLTIFFPHIFVDREASELPLSRLKEAKVEGDFSRTASRIGRTPTHTHARATLWRMSLLFMGFREKVEKETSGCLTLCELHPTTTATRRTIARCSRQALRSGNTLKSLN
jgi:hypothetical protein